MSESTELIADRYQLMEVIGEGGMAIVYKALDTRLDRYVAIKFISSSHQLSSELLIRFDRDAKTLAQLSHPNIVRILDYGSKEHTPYLVMDYLPGGTLKSKIKQPWPWKEAATILAPIAHALDYAHKHKIIHRDVKPSNILMTDTGIPMLCDFGIAKLIQSEETATESITRTGVSMGTPEYMSPEQGIGKEIDGRSDIYALGIVFYELVTGRKPFQATTPVGVLVKQATETPQSPKQYIPHLPDEIDKGIMKALAKQPENRYQDMSEFAEVLDRLQMGQYGGITKQNKPGINYRKLSILAVVSLFAIWGFISMVMNASLSPLDGLATTEHNPVSETVDITLTISAMPTLSPTSTLQSTQTRMVTRTLAPTKTKTPAASPTTFVEAVLKSDTANVRSGPGTVYSVISVMIKGTIVKLIGKAQDRTGALWFVIRLSNNRNGWISERVLERLPAGVNNLPNVTPPPTPKPPTPEPTKEPNAPPQNYPTNTIPPYPYPFP